MKSINLLAIDTATEACSAAVCCNSQTFHEFEVCPQQHSQKALPMVQSVLNAANTTLTDMDYLVFGRGPGSFTGVRIACGMIQGLAMGAAKRAIGVSTLAAMAQQVAANKVAVAVDARMNEVYYAEYVKQDGHLLLHGEERVIPPQIAAESALVFGPDAIAGTGWAAYSELATLFPHLAVDVLYPSARYMLDIARAQIEAAEDDLAGVEANKIEPVYLRDKVTWKKLPGRE